MFCPIYSIHIKVPGRKSSKEWKQPGRLSTNDQRVMKCTRSGFRKSMADEFGTEQPKDSILRENYYISTCFHLKLRPFKDDSPFSNHDLSRVQSTQFFNVKTHEKSQLSQAFRETFLTSHGTGDLRLPLRAVATSNVLATGKDHSSTWHKPLGTQTTAVWGLTNVFVQWKHPDSDAGNLFVSFQSSSQTWQRSHGFAGCTFDQNWRYWDPDTLTILIPLKKDS